MPRPSFLKHLELDCLHIGTAFCNKSQILSFQHARSLVRAASQAHRSPLLFYRSIAVVEEEKSEQNIISCKIARDRQFRYMEESLGQKRKDRLLQPLQSFAKLLSEAEDSISGQARLMNSRGGSDGEPEASEDGMVKGAAHLQKFLHNIYDFWRQAFLGLQSICYVSNLLCYGEPRIWALLSFLIETDVNDSHLMAESHKETVTFLVLGDPTNCDGLNQIYSFP